LHKGVFTSGVEASYIVTFKREHAEILDDEKQLLREMAIAAINESPSETT
jgi:hypothetical protein